MSRSTSLITGGDPQAVTGSGESIELKSNSSQTCNTGTLPRNIHVRMAYDEGSKQYSCDLLAVDPANQGEDLMTKLREMSEGDSGAFLRFIAACGDAFLMRQDSVWLVSVSLVSDHLRITTYLSILTPEPAALQQRGCRPRGATSSPKSLHRVQRVQRASHTGIPPPGAAPIREGLCTLPSRRRRRR
jgi:hypothetical protein